jgi:hypothetical protein
MEIEIRAVYSYNSEINEHEIRFEVRVCDSLLGLFSQEDLFTLLKVLTKKPLMPPPPPKPI